MSCTAPLVTVTQLLFWCTTSIFSYKTYQGFCQLLTAHPLTHISIHYILLSSLNISLTTCQELLELQCLSLVPCVLHHPTVLLHVSPLSTAALVQSPVVCPQFFSEQQISLNIIVKLNVFLTVHHELTIQ